MKNEYAIKKFDGQHSKRGVFVLEIPDGGRNTDERYLPYHDIKGGVVRF